MHSKSEVAKLDAAVKCNETLGGEEGWRSSIDSPRSWEGLFVPPATRAVVLLGPSPLPDPNRQDPLGHYGQGSPPPTLLPVGGGAIPLVVPGAGGDDCEGGPLVEGSGAAWMIEGPDGIGRETGDGGRADVGSPVPVGGAEVLLLEPRTNPTTPPTMAPVTTIPTTSIGILHFS